MKICIYGAGAIGGTLGARLALAGQEVSLIARGAHLAAIRANGLTLIKGSERHTVKLAASDNSADLGKQDAVIIALKSHTLSAAVDGIMPLLADETSVVTAMMASRSSREVIFERSAAKAVTVVSADKRAASRMTMGFIGIRFLFSLATGLSQV